MGLLQCPIVARRFVLARTPLKERRTAKRPEENCRCDTVCVPSTSSPSAPNFSNDSCFRARKLLRAAKPRASKIYNPRLPGPWLCGLYTTYDIQCQPALGRPRCRAPRHFLATPLNSRNVTRTYNFANAPAIAFSTFLPKEEKSRPGSGTVLHSRTG